jgi:hypothetical protein
MLRQIGSRASASSILRSARSSTAARGDAPTNMDTEGHVGSATRGKERDGARTGCHDENDEEFRLHFVWL